jgi:hypothetical protein
VVVVVGNEKHSLRKQVQVFCWLWNVESEWSGLETEAKNQKGWVGKPEYYIFGKPLRCFVSVRTGHASIASCRRKLSGPDIAATGVIDRAEFNPVRGPEAPAARKA